MTTPMYRIGQVARLLQVSNHHIRQLCASGLIRGAEQTDGGWHVPVDEVKRLQVEGVPPIPALGTSVRPPSPLPATARAGHAPTSHRSDTDGTITPMEAVRRLVDLATGEAESEELQFPEEEENASAEVREALDSVQIEAARLQQRKIQLRKEEVEDSFRARDAARVAEAQRARAEQNRQLEEAARVEWRNCWLKYAQNKIPYDASPSVRLQVNDAVAAVLDNKLSVNDDKAVVTRLVDATVAIALEPCHRARQREGIIDRTIPSLPADFYWHLRRVDTGMDDIKQLAREAIDALGSTATEAQMKSAALRALQPLVAAFQHNEAKRKLVAEVGSWRQFTRDSPTADERSAATEAVKQALDKCVPTATVAELEKVKAQVLATFDQKIEQRVQAKRRREEAEDETDRALRHVTTYVGNEYEFDSFFERLNDEKSLEDALRPILIAKFLAGEFREATSAHPFIDQYIDQHIRLEESDDRPSSHDHQHVKRT